MEEVQPEVPQVQPALPLLRSLLASSFAGGIARIVCHPIDTIKARLQSGRNSSTKLNSLSSLYRGLGAAVIGGVPAICIYLTTYDVAKEILRDAPVIRESPFGIYFCSGLLAEACSCIVFVPTDVIKERMQVGVAPSLNYNRSGDVLRQILKTEGVRGLYRGYAATLLAFGPFSALYFTFYEALKKRSSRGGMTLTFADSLYR